MWTPLTSNSESAYMLAILRDISITCFTASYLVVLVLEVLRLFFARIPGRGIAVIAMTVIGLFTHATYLILREAKQTIDGQTVHLGTWTDWALMMSLALAVGFAILHFRRPDTVVGLFFLPAVLALIAIAIGLRDQPPFSRDEAFEVWRSLHALGMALGSAAVLTGFLTGVMYLVQSWRLKSKRAGSSLRLPTLEMLQSLLRGSLLSSTAAVGIGLIAGVVMNLNRYGVVGWNEGGVLLSSVLFLWLVAASLVELFYAPARRGRKIAYLTMASFGFLVLAMVGVSQTQHGTDPSARAVDDAAATSVHAGGDSQ